MALLQGIYGELADPLFAFYWNKFKGTDDERFKNATNSIINSFKPTSTEKFPCPARFVEALGDDEQTIVNLAVGAVKRAASTYGVYKSLSFGDRALHAAIMRFGGWPQVASWDDEQWRYREKNFIATYEAEKFSCAGPDHLMGLAEIDYDNRRFDISPDRSGYFAASIFVHDVPWKGYQRIAIAARPEPMKIGTEEAALLSEITEAIKTPELPPAGVVERRSEY